MVRFIVDGITGSYDAHTDTLRWDTLTCCYADAPIALRRAANRASLYR